MMTDYERWLYETTGKTYAEHMAEGAAWRKAERAAWWRTLALVVVVMALLAAMGSPHDDHHPTEPIDCYGSVTCP